jgi:GT2 family glycosyltransferase
MIANGVDFVVCTRNNRAIIEDTLWAIVQQQVEHFTLTVVDGRSTDGTPDYVRSAFPSANVIVKEQDSGPAASRNIGIAQGTMDWIVLVDSDVRLRLDWVACQLAFMREHQVDIACGKLVYSSKPQTLNAVYGVMNRFGIAWDKGVGDPADSHNEPRPCLWACTSALAIRRSVAEAIGGFDETMFIAHEDCDYGWRANLMGYRVAYNPGAVALHRAHGTVNARMAQLLYRNRLRSALINYEGRHILRYVFPYIAMACGDLLIRGPRGVKLRALLWNLANLPDTLRRRAQVQAKRRIRDCDLWSLFEAGFRGPGFREY